MKPEAHPQDLSLLLVGTDYRCAPLELREKVACGPAETEEVLVHLLARPEVAEAYLLSTCNRTEIYLRPREEESAYATVLERIFTGREPELARPGRLYVKRNGDAARHLLAVASGLESMVLGEPEILGQVKQAAVLAEAVGANGTVLRRLLRSAVAAGKRARSETGISTGAVSLGYAAIELAKNIFTHFEQSRVLLVGAGETARLVARSLSERGIDRITVTNRTRERAEALREELPGIQIVPFEERVAAVADADLVVATTGAEEPILTREQIRGAMARRSSQPLLIVDLGVPRNVEPRARRIENVFLHSLDSLDQLIDRNLKRRREAVPKVEELIEDELERFSTWYRGLEAEPLIARLQKQAEEIRRRELEAALTRFPRETHGDLERLTRALVRKILHHPSATLRGGDREESLPHLELVRELFHLDDDEGES